MKIYIILSIMFVAVLILFAGLETASYRRQKAQAAELARQKERNSELLQEVEEANEKAEKIIMQRTVELIEKNRTLTSSHEQLLELLGDLVEMRDEEADEHILHIKAYSKILALQLRKSFPEYGLTEDDARVISSASALHDLGKMLIPDEIILKPGKLTSEEETVMRSHSEKGYELLKRTEGSGQSKYLRVAMEICRSHHEKWDGAGYPQGLKGDEIPISAQIVSVADCFDVLTSTRNYKAPYSVEEALNMILNGECGAFSPKLLQCLQECKDKLIHCAPNPNAVLNAEVNAVQSEGRFSGMVFLLVDDNDLTREIHRDLLEAEGAVVREAADGGTAIEAVRTDSEIDAVLMDLVMPGIDGVEATARIRAIEKGRAASVPIIAISADSEDSRVKECLRAGADAHLTKPLIIADFTRVLLGCVRNRGNDA